MASADEILGLTTAQPGQTADVSLSVSSAGPTTGPESSGSQATGPQPDFVGRAKANILSLFGGGDLPRDPSGTPAGDPRGPEFLVNSLGAIGNVLMPGSWEEIAIQAAGGLPGKGLAPALARGSLQVAAPAGIAALKGEDPTAAAGKGAIAAATSAATGGLARMAARAGSRAFSQDTARLADMVGAVAPGMRGADARATISNILSGAGHRQAQHVMDVVEDAVVMNLQRTAPGGVVRIPSLARLRVPPIANTPDLYRPEDALRYIKTLEKTAAGNPTAAVRDSVLIGEARREFEALIPSGLRESLTNARANYHRTQQIHRLFTGKGDTGRGDEITPSTVERVIPEGKAAERGEVDMGELQRNYQALRGDMMKAFTPGEMERWDRALRFEPLRRDVAGSTPRIGISSWGGVPHPYAHGRFRLPRRTGGSETLAEIAAQAGRQAGARIPHVLDDMPAPVPTQEQKLGAMIPPVDETSDARRALNWLQGIPSPQMGPRAAPVPRPSITTRIPQ